jgi:uncharacterized protein
LIAKRIKEKRKFIQVLLSTRQREKTTLAHYLELLFGAGLLCGLQKFAKQKIRQKGSSPKFCVYNTALISAQSTKTFKDAKKDRIFWGRLVESAVGAHLLNSSRGTQK